MSALPPTPPATSPAPIRVLVVDDHTIVRQGLVALLASSPGLAVVGEAGTAGSALEAAARLQPDVVLLDLSLPDLPGTTVLQRLADVAPAARVLVLSMHDSEEYVRPAVAAGARGYLVKGSGLGDLVAAIGAVAAGQAFFSPAAAASLLPTQGKAPTGDAERLASLSLRERQVLELVALGLTSVEIGDRLAISQKTVEAHRANLSAKLGLRDVPALVRFAVRTGLVPLGD